MALPPLPSASAARPAAAATGGRRSNGGGGLQPDDRAEDADRPGPSARRSPRAAAVPARRRTRREPKSQPRPPPESRPVPPWQSPPPAAAQIIAADGGHLPALRIHRAYEAQHPAVDIQSYASGDNEFNDDGGDDAADGAAIASANNAGNAANVAALPTNAPKYVTFGTHDRIHQWDEQLDVLKYVDEEFFAVAHFLIDVVGASNDPDQFRFWGGEEKEGREEPRRGVPFAGLVMPLFQCGVGREVEGFPVVDSFDSNGSWPDGEGGGGGDAPRRRNLTEKLVQDFAEALRYRAEIMKSKASNHGDYDEEEEEEEKEKDKKTREIIRKVNAYGLPLLQPSARVAISLDESENPSQKEEQAIDKEEGEEEDDDEEFLDTFGKKPKQQFFPVIPVDDDEEDDEHDGGSNENDPSLSNRRHSLNESKGAKPNSKESPEQLQAATAFQLPTLASICAKFLRGKSSSAVPSEEDCRRRLSQIRLEVEKVQKMIDATQNVAVQAACQRRTEKLKVERRFYQIVQERYKVQSMIESTEVPYVRKACQERFSQLIVELGTLKLEEEEEEEVAEKEEDEKKEVVEEENGPADEKEVAKAVPAEDEGPACELACGKPELAVCDEKSAGSDKSVRSEGVQVGQSAWVKSEGVQAGKPGCGREEPTYGASRPAFPEWVKSEGVQAGAPACVPDAPDNHGEPTKAVAASSFACGVDEPAEALAKSTFACASPASVEAAAKSRFACGESDEWYDRVLKVLTGEPTLREELRTAGRLPEDSPPPKRDGYDPETWRDERHSQRHHSEKQHGRDQVRFLESHDHDRHGPPLPRGSENRWDEYEHTGDPRSIVSPASDEAVYQNRQFLRGQDRQKRRSPVARRPAPVARAVESSSSWFDDIKGLLS